MAITRVQFGGATGSNKTPRVTLGSVPAQNNLLVCLIVAAEVSASSITSPSGFTEVDSGLAQGTLAYKLSYEIAPRLHSGTESGSLPSNANWAMIIVEYSGETTTSDLDVTVNGQAASGTSLALGPTGTTSQSSELAIAAMGFGGAPGTVSYTNSFTTVSTQSGSISASIGELITGSATTFSTTASWGSAQTSVGAVAGFKANVVSSPQTVSNAGLIASGQAFGTATVTPGTATISPAGIASTEAFGTTAMGNVLAPSGIGSAETFGSPTVSPQTVSIFPAGISSSQAFGSPVVTGPATISPTGIASSEGFGDAGILGGVPSYNAGVIYEQPDWVYDEPGQSFGGGSNNLFLFRTPGRINIDLEGAFAWSLWTRVHRLVPITLLQHHDTTWEEFAASPYTLEPSNKYLYGGRNFFNSDGITFDIPIRFYIGGHTYIINEQEKIELRAAHTPQEPNGYEAYITAAPPGSVYTGDEIILSGFQTEFAS